MDISESIDLSSSMVLFLQDLVRIRSVCGIDAEWQVANRIRLECDKLNLKSELVSAPDQHRRPNVIVTAGVLRTFSYDP